MLYAVLFFNQRFQFKGTITINVRGLNKSIKRCALFRWLHKQNKDFTFLQETYSSSDTAKIWEAEWGGKVLFNHGTNHSKGVMILLNPKLDCKIEKISQDKNDRFVIGRLTIDDSHLVLVNIYSPNDINQQVHFFKELQDQLQEYPHENVIIGGDFYCALTQRDKEGGNTVTRKLSVINEINKLCELYNLCDIWHSLNPDARQFTWRDKSFKVQCRLDYFLFLMKCVTTRRTAVSILLLTQTTPPCKLILLPRNLNKIKDLVFGNSILLCLKTIDMFPNYVKTF